MQREIVSGLKYVQRVTRMNVPGTVLLPTVILFHGRFAVDKDEFMVGSYGPKTDVQSYTTPMDEAPSGTSQLQYPSNTVTHAGMMHRGTYKVKSCFTDDDQNEWLMWTWTLEIKKDWE